MLSLLPSHVHPNPGPDPDNPDHKIEPLPQSFLRYSNNWRDAVRGFQFDLESGRYDPEWQAQAALAMEERVSGKFDQFKEDQYEEFWGQKQKLRYDVETGDSNQVKLETLVKNKVIRVGDVWKYSRLFVKDGRILIEKEVKVRHRLSSTKLVPYSQTNARNFKILSVDENYALTFAIPGGHRVFLKQDYAKSESPGAQTAPGSSNGSESNAEVNSKPEAESKQAEVKPEPETESVAAPENGSATKVEVEAEASVEVKRDSESSNSSDPSNLPATDGDPALKGDTPMPSAPPAEEDNNPTGQSSLSNADDEPTLKEDTPMPTAPPTAEDTTAQDTVPQNTTSDKTTVENNTAGGPTSDVPISENSTPGESMSNSPVPNDATKSDADVILPGVYQPNTLGVKILKIDGRITKPSHGNAWKDFRCIRNNQDMGSLWEVRQAWSMKGK